MALEKPIGKELEILRHIAMNGPCTSSYLSMRGKDSPEAKEHWSSRTVMKQIPRLRKQGFISKTENGFKATDDGFYHLIQHTGSDTTARELDSLVKRATELFPDGRSAQLGRIVTSGGISTKRIQLKQFREWCQMVDGFLEKDQVPADFHFKMEIRTNSEGRRSLRSDNGWNLDDYLAPRKKRSTLSKDEYEVLMAAGRVGKLRKLDPANLTLQQKQFLRSRTSRN